MTADSAAHQNLQSGQAGAPQKAAGKLQIHLFHRHSPWRYDAWV